MRIIYGGADVGAAAVHHRLADEIHITGSIDSHDRIVWGPPGAERDQRMRANLPLLAKPVTSELGNVSPWIFLPGEYSRRQLAFQAENVAASVVNNVSFNCVATKVLITWKRWPLRSQFLDLIDAVFARTPSASRTTRARSTLPALCRTGLGRGVDRLSSLDPAAGCQSQRESPVFRRGIVRLRGGGSGNRRPDAREFLPQSG